MQHLIEADRTIGELARRMQVTQQAASKVVAELEELGYLERAPDSADARVRRVKLSPKGQNAVAAARRARASLERRLARRCGTRALAATRRCLAEALAELGGVEAVRARRVRPPG